MIKKLLFLSSLTFIASLAYAGAGCGSCGGDKKDKKSDKATESTLVESVELFAGAGCGSCGGDKKDKKSTTKETTEESGFRAEPTALV